MLSAVEAELERRVAHRADHLGVVGQHALRQLGRQLLDAGIGGGGILARALGPGRIGGPALQQRRQLLEPGAGIGHQRAAAPLAGVVGLDVQAQQPRMGKQRVRAGGEILQAGADGKHQVGRARQLVGARDAIDADRAQVERMVPGQAALAPMRLDHRHAMGLGKGAQRVPGLAVEHATADHDQRLARLAQQRGGAGELARIGRRATEAQQLGLQEAFRAVERHRLHVLRQRQAGRAAVGRVGHHLDRARQRGQDMFGPGQPVEIARDRAEAVAGADIALGEALDLLQHRVGAAAGEHVARQQQHRQPVDMGHGGGGHEVGRAGADAGADRHDALAKARLGIGDRGVGHGLFVVGAKGRQPVALGHQGFAHAGHVAVTEDGEDPAAIGLDLAVVGFDAQRGQVLDQRLRQGESLGFHDL